MKILVINCGSSSLKYQLLNMEDESVMAIGLVERIGIEGSRIKHETTGYDKKEINVELKDHKIALEEVLKAVTNAEYGAIKSIEEIDAVGHRVVHGGEKFAESVLINEEVMAAMKECIELAPLHNPANIMGIEAMQELLPNAPMVAVFDTSFHQTMPAESYIYALPYEYYEKYGVRRYGFHGTSHKYVAQRAAVMMNKPLEELKLISCHLGNGASITAIDGGKSVATSMGFTPLEGLIMGTRCGDIDPAIIKFIMDKEGADIAKMDNVMNKESGVYGISGVSSDFRDIEKAASEGNERAKLAIEAFNERVVEYIGAYAARMGGVDGIIFTAGLGENGCDNREAICSKLGFLGVDFCAPCNKKRGVEMKITRDESKVMVMVIPTNEELMIARDTQTLSQK